MRLRVLRFLTTCKRNPAWPPLFGPSGLSCGPVGYYGLSSRVRIRRRTTCRSSRLPGCARASARSRPWTACPFPSDRAVLRAARPQRRGQDLDHPHALRVFACGRRLAQGLRPGQSRPLARDPRPPRRLPAGQHPGPGLERGAEPLRLRRLLRLARDVARNAPPSSWSSSPCPTSARPGSWSSPAA
jgi:hypothetical protein